MMHAETDTETTTEGGLQTPIGSAAHLVPVEAIHALREDYEGHRQSLGDCRPEVHADLALWALLAVGVRGRSAIEDGLRLCARAVQALTGGVEPDAGIPAAVLRLAEVVRYGAGKRGINNWRRIPWWSHYDHAVEHLCRWLDGDRDSEDHLGHALCRAAFAFALWPELEPNLRAEREVPSEWR